jgi:cytosine/adenosine deaminase-related metal-dependent hydrolase
MDRDAVARFRASGAALIWCPSSNLFLFGRTAPDALLADGVDLLLGSDSRLTGEGDLLDELQCARRLGLIDDSRLEAAVGTTAARVLGLSPPSLAPGSLADITLLARPLLGATTKDVLLVIVSGEIRLLDPDLAGAFGAWLPAGVMRTRGNLTRWTSGH